MTERTTQLPLAIGLDVEARFETFFEGANEAAVAALKSLCPPGIWLAGTEGTGRSHLLQAVAAARGAGEVIYLPLAQGLPPQALDGLPGSAVICLDDIDAVAGSMAWERALLVLYESLYAGAGCLLASAGHAAKHSGFELPDLVSRLASLSHFRLERPDDEGQLAALKMRADARGLRLPDEVARFMVQRLPRDLPRLFDWLVEVDRQSLAAGRRLTVPFVRDVIRQASLD